MYIIFNSNESSVIAAAYFQAPITIEITNWMSKLLAYINHASWIISLDSLEFTWFTWIHLIHLNSLDSLEFTWFTWIGLIHLNSLDSLEFTWLTWIHLIHLNSLDSLEFTWFTWIHWIHLNSIDSLEFTWFQPNISRLLLVCQHFYWVCLFEYSPGFRVSLSYRVKSLLGIPLVPACNLIDRISPARKEPTAVEKRWEYLYACNTPVLTVVAARPFI